MTDNHTDEVDLELERLRRELTEWRDNARYRCVWCDWTGPSSAEDAREHRRGCEAWLDALELESRELRAALSGLMPFVEEDFPEGDNLPVTWAYGQAVLKARSALSPKKETT